MAFQGQTGHSVLTCSVAIAVFRHCPEFHGRRVFLSLYRDGCARAGSRIGSLRVVHYGMPCCAHVLWACPLLPPKTHASPSWYLMFSTGMWQTRSPHCCPKPSQSSSLHRGAGKAVFPGRLSHLTTASHEKSCKWCADELSLTTLLLYFWAQTLPGNHTLLPQPVASRAAIGADKQPSQPRLTDSR